MALAGIVPLSSRPETLRSAASTLIRCVRCRDGRRWLASASLRERIRARRTSRAVYRFVVALLGVAITLGGLLLVPLPGPGWLIVLAGLALLATEFEPARRLLEFARRTLQRWTSWLGAARDGGPRRRGGGDPRLRGGRALGCAVVAGVPAWVPDAVVPPLPGLHR